MSLPVPRAGLVIRYSFLWSHEVRKGATEGRKDRPAAIVVATRKGQDGDVHVIVAPITHEPPEDPAASIEIPIDTVKALGLDGDRQWIRLDELNRFTWPGFDLRPVPGGAGAYDYGLMPEDLYARMKVGILERQGTCNAKITPRD
jgi:hypothetical protein